MELVGTSRLSEEFISLELVFRILEKPLNSFETADFFPDEELKKLSAAQERLQQIITEIDTRLTAGSL